MSKPETIMIDEVKYVKADSLPEKAALYGGMERSIVRSYGAGVFFGYVKEKKSELNGVNIILLQAKRIYYWDGACSLTQLALDGTKAKNNCKITEAVDSQFIADVIEIIPLTKRSSDNLDEVKIWKR